jgi:hypothetical protein
MRATPRCESLEDWFTRKQWNQEWFEWLKNSWFLSLDEEYLQIAKIQFRRRILEQVETGVGKRNIFTRQLIETLNILWEDWDKKWENEYNQKIKQEVENCVFDYNQIMNMSMKDGYQLMRASDLRVLLDVFPKEWFSFIEKKEIFMNFFDFFTLIFWVHDFPSDRSKSIFHPQYFTLYWLRQTNPKKREDYKLDEEGKEVILYHNNLNQINFWIAKRDQYWIWILTREIQ